MTRYEKGMQILIDGVWERINEIELELKSSRDSDKKSRLKIESTHLRTASEHLNRAMEINAFSKKPKPRSVNRSAVDGKFVTKKYADKNPDTTFKDRIK